MKPLSALTVSDLSKIKLVSFDVDGVLVQQGTEVFEMEDVSHNNVLIVKTKRISPALVDKLNRLKKHLFINISSGRSLLYLMEVFDPILWNNSSLQGENGLFTLIGGKVIQNTNLTLEELELLKKVRSEIHKIALENANIRGFEPKQFLLSVHCFKEELAIEDLVHKLDKNNELGIKWSSEAYNIFPKRISKGSGLKSLSKLLNIDLAEMLVVGNDPNDKEAVEGPGISVTTSPKTLTANYYTESSLELGGEALVDRLLKIYK